MKVLSVIGARPQFIKAAVVSAAFREQGVREVLVNTGQHFSYNMSQQFVEELKIPQPDYDLGVGSGTHAWQTARSLTALEAVLLDEAPELVLVYGDTNATLAGALAAAKLNIPVGHVEAGLRSFNRYMPEEINRIAADSLAVLRFCPTTTALRHLETEGFRTGNHLVGDVMYDALKRFTPPAIRNTGILGRLSLKPGRYVLMTIHRPSNADDPNSLAELLQIVDRAGVPVVFPAHPRVRNSLRDLDMEPLGHIRIINPVGYLEMLALEAQAGCILTDSGGVQKEAYLHRVPCLTFRAETEWTETVADGWNILVHDQPERIPALLQHFPEPDRWAEHYGDGQAARKIVAKVIRWLSNGSAAGHYAEM